MRINLDDVRTASKYYGHPTFRAVWLRCQRAEWPVSAETIHYFTVREHKGVADTVRILGLPVSHERTA